ncbi:MAG: hypothetical protein MPJ50_14650 [Pirellulales bacterium]|nr:hypothetical protein [Pirellulales bacterium]
MNMTRWDWFLFAFAAFLAVRALVRMLIARRDDIQAALERERIRTAKEKRRQAQLEAAAAQAEMMDAGSSDETAFPGRAA